jgi:hypothetical protein
MLGAARDRQAVARQISNEWVQANAKQTSKEASREASKCIQIQSVTTTISINYMNSCVAAFIGFVVEARACASGSFVAKLPRSRARHHLGQLPL